METKICKLCHSNFNKPYKYSKKQWEGKEFCCVKCRAQFYSRHGIAKKSMILSWDKRRKGWYITKQGYKAVWVGNIDRYNHLKYPYVLEHRLVMEQKLERLLLETEHVHHINRNKLDNRVENLQLL